MYEFERTHDLDYVVSCLTRPQVWRMTCDDQMKNIDPQLFFLPDKLPFYYLKVKPDYGVLIGEPKGPDVYEVHVALTRDAIGSSVEICREAVEWFFKNEECSKIIAAIPVYNHHAMRLAKYVGFLSAGTRPNAFFKDGKPYDLRLFEINKEDICHH